MIDKVFSFAELGHQEVETSKYLTGVLESAGFEVEYGISGVPTGWIARWKFGEGPVIALGSDVDGIPKASQYPGVAYHKPMVEGAPGHGEGHNSGLPVIITSALVIQELMEKNNIGGTLVVWPGIAEEQLAAKAWFVKDGYFDDVDIVLHWHPASGNSADAQSSNSNKSGKFTFSGISAHAASAPEKGRSALDGVEAMNMMVNMMREHVPQESRIHYVITKGGLAPNVVPDIAEVYYYVRHPRMNVVDELFQRVVKAAEGAALGTETSMSYEVMHGNYAVLPNETLQKMIHKNLSELEE